MIAFKLNKSDYFCLVIRRHDMTAYAIFISIYNLYLCCFVANHFRTLYKIIINSNIQTLGVIHDTSLSDLMNYVYQMTGLVLVYVYH